MCWIGWQLGYIAGNRMLIYNSDYNSDMSI